MRGFDGFGYFLAEFRKEFGHDAVSGKPLAVPGFEKLFADDAFRVDEEISGAGKALLHPGRLLIEDAIRLDDPGLGVPEQGVLDLVPVGEKLQDFFRVIADGRQLDPLLFESRNCTLQLDQLPFAEGSPVGGTEKQKHRAVRSFQGIERLHPAKLVAKRKSWSLLIDR